VTISHKDGGAVGKEALFFFEDLGFWRKGGAAF